MLSVLKKPLVRSLVFWTTFMNIIFVLAFIVSLPVSESYDSEANTKVTEIQLASFKQAIHKYVLTTGRLPKSLNDLVDKPEGVTNWRQILETIPDDPWGNSYKYTASKTSFSISSFGPTGTDLDYIKVSDSVKLKAKPLSYQ